MTPEQQGQVFGEFNQAEDNNGEVRWNGTRIKYYKAACRNDGWEY